MDGEGEQSEAAQRNNRKEEKGNPPGAVKVFSQTVWPAPMTSFSEVMLTGLRLGNRLCSPASSSATCCPPFLPSSSIGAPPTQHSLNLTKAAPAKMPTFWKGFNKGKEATDFYEFISAVYPGKFPLQNQSDALRSGGRGERLSAVWGALGGLCSSPGTDVLMTARSRGTRTKKLGLADVRPQMVSSPEIRSSWGGCPVLFPAWKPGFQGVVSWWVNILTEIMEV